MAAGEQVSKGLSQARIGSEAKLAKDISAAPIV
jgi:hypothetical protein